MEIIVAEHALRHGLTESEIVYAWENFIRKQRRKSPNETQVAAIGYDRKGRLIQMVAVDIPSGVLIYHAMTPPTAKVLIELGFARR